MNYYLIDDINDKNICYLVNNKIEFIGNDVDYITIHNFTELVNYFDNYYGKNLFGYLCSEYHALDTFKNYIINKTNGTFVIARIKDTNSINKYFTTPTYKYAFNKVNGVFMRWKDNISNEDDVLYAPMGPEIADIEISTICHGIGEPCIWCYKSNNPDGLNMHFDNYKKYISILNQNKTLTQVALGVGDIDANADLEDILKYTRELGIIPNITINGARMNDYYYKIISKYCGAVSISRYNDDELLFENINRFDKEKMHEDSNLFAINIHQLLCKDTYDNCIELLEKIHNDKLFMHVLHSIVFLTMKPIGKRNIYKELVSDEEYNRLVKLSFDYNIPIGFDSCGCYNFLKSIKDNPLSQQYTRLAESCESTLFSIYVDVHGQVYPCSFAEHYNGKISDIREPLPNLNNVDDLLMDVWHCEAFHSFRRKLFDNYSEEYKCRRCPLFKLHN